MTYPPGNPGYPPAQQGNQYAPTQQYGEPAEVGPSKLPVYLTAAVAVFGLATYAFNFGPLLTISNSDFPQFGSASGSTPGLGLAVAASVLAALLAGVGLLPKQKARTGLVAVASTLSFLLVLAEVINAPAGLSIGWGLYLVIATTLLQTGASIAALLFDAGVLSPPAPKPRYEQQQPYGQYGAPYYGQPGGQQQYGAPTHQPQQQRPGYPSQYGYQGAPNTGGFQSAAGAPGSHNGPPTPPTGFPAFGQPSRASEATGYEPQGSSAPTAAVPSQSAATPPSHPESSPQSGTPSS
ncbi:hypothetical protein ASE48_05995 [Mycobacterium sp. Root265]|uniref:DUF5336 domain-containing protein n=1 Tax=Mycobacterium sp. Root265 TaxID=1736504 RepID=UPI000710106E|nr:DUF5336 domain-containing protein [Mycobacterium sp. Root265]KRD09585.1 hypothetical protein ASE48_05995 [Mycobacterium sp. Root265]